MKKVLILLLSIYISQTSVAQSGGFSRLYEFNDRGADFSSITFSNDTLFVYGTGCEMFAQPYYGIMLVSMDTLGNVLGAHYLHEPDEHMLAVTGSQVVKTANGGFASVGQYYNPSRGFLTKFNNIGEVQSNSEYSIPDVFTMFPRRLIELQDGSFLVGGYYSKLDYSIHQFVKRITPGGQEIWSKSYGASTDWNRMDSFIKIDDSTFVIGGTHGPIHFDEVEWLRSHIFAITPKLGFVKWDWMGPLNEEAGVAGLHRTADNGWIYQTYTYEPNPVPDPIEYYVSHIKVVRRDSAFNLLWERTLSPAKSYWNRVGDLEATPDGNWVASGFWLSDTHKSCLYKFSDQGDSLWCTCLTPSDTLEGLTELGGIAVLPSGSTICTARYDKYVPGPSKTYGWLIKVDNDGCVDTLCDLSVVFAPPPAPSQKVLAYPNPATSKIVIASDLPFDKQAVWSVFDAFGRTARSGKIDREANSIEIDLSGMANGLYFWEIRAQNGQTRSGRFVKQNE